MCKIRAGHFGKRSHRHFVFQNASASFFTLFSPDMQQVPLEKSKKIKKIY
jgi:hypothetical protein